MPGAGAIHPICFPPKLAMTASDPLRTLVADVKLGKMSDEDEKEPQTLNQAHWWVQPRWVKILTVVVAIPSWLYLCFGTDVDPTETVPGKVALGGFISVCILQMIFVFRGYWRMDI
jgi:hypothetical protein